MTLHFKNGDGGRIARALRQGPTELYFIGASVTAQRDGWPDRLLRQVRSQTGHNHTACRNAMGGVGLLFGVSNHGHWPPGVLPRVALLEFSTGDLNLGLTPPEHLAAWLIELVARLAAEDTPVVFIHNWRGDFESDDRAGIRRQYDDVAALYGIPVIENHRMVDASLAEGMATKEGWFRDVCHTQPPGAEACAQHVWACLQAMQALPASTGHDLPAAPACEDQIRDFPLPPELAPAGASLSSFEYPATLQRFAVTTVAEQDRIRLRASGRLLGAAFISGPRASWVVLDVDGSPVRRFRLFDRNSHYRRCVVLPVVKLLDKALLELHCDGTPVDFSIAQQPHPDFELPRQMSFVHFIGSGLSFESA